MDHELRTTGVRNDVKVSLSCDRGAGRRNRVGPSPVAGVDSHPTDILIDNIYIDIRFGPVHTFMFSLGN